MLVCDLFVVVSQGRDGNPGSQGIPGEDGMPVSKMLCPSFSSFLFFFFFSFFFHSSAMNFYTITVTKTYIPYVC